MCKYSCPVFCPVRLLFFFRLLFLKGTAERAFFRFSSSISKRSRLFSGSSRLSNLIDSSFPKTKVQEKSSLIQKNPFSIWGYRKNTRGFRLLCVSGEKILRFMRSSGHVRQKLDEKLLALTAPWRVQEVDLQTKEMKVTLKRPHQPFWRFRCQDCDEVCPTHDQRQRQWSHLDTCGYATLIERNVSTTLRHDI